MEYVSLQYVATRWNLSLDNVRRLAQRGKLPGATKPAGRWRIHLPTLESAWKPQTYTPTPPHHGASVLPTGRAQP